MLILTMILAMANKPLRAVSKPMYEAWMRAKQELKVRRMVASHPVAGGAINTTGVTPAANFIEEKWAPEISDATQAHIGLASYVDRGFEAQMKSGDIIHIQDWSNPAVRVKSEDTAATIANITETQQNITINRQAYVRFLIEDVAEVQSKYEIRSTYTTKGTYSLMAYIEGDVTSGLTSLPDNFSQLVGILGQDPTTDNLIRAKQYLDDGDVPESDRFFYMAPPTHASLLKQDVFVSGDYGPAGAVSSGNVSKPVYGATTHVSSLANNNPSGAGQSYSWFAHKRGVVLLLQQAPKVNPPWWNTDYFGWDTVISTIYQFAERLIAPSTLGGGTSDDRFNVAVRGA